MEDIDNAFLHMFIHFIELADLHESSLIDEQAGIRIDVDELKAEMPIEMDIAVDDRGQVQLGSSPPIYYANTSIQPVYHYMKITIKGEKRI